MRKLLAVSIAFAVLVVVVWRATRSSETREGARSNAATEPAQDHSRALAEVTGPPELATELAVPDTTSLRESAENERKPAPVGSVRGRILDQHGAPVDGRWTVYGESGPRPGGGRTIHVAVDPLTGEFRLDSLLPGRNQLTARSRSGAWIEGPFVEVLAGSETTTDLVYGGRKRSEEQSIRVSAYDPRFPSAPIPTQSSVRLIAANGSSREASSFAGHQWRFDDVGFDEYTVSIDDPRFEPWSRSGVVRGEIVYAQLVANSAIALSVVDGSSGLAIESYEVRVRYRSDANGSLSNELQLRAAPGTRPVDGVYAGMVPGSFVLIIDVPGYAKCAVGVDDLAPSETRAVVARMMRGSVVSGAVFYAGKPLLGVAIELSPYVADPRDLAASRASYTDAARTRSDVDGRFEFANVAPGDYSVYAHRGPGSGQRLGPITCPGATRDLHIELPVGGTLVGRVLAPPAASFEHLSIELTRRFTGQETPGHAPYVRDGMEGLHENFLEEFEDYAAFSFGPVRAAQYDVWLSTGDFLLDSAGDSVRRQDGPRVHLGTVELAANVDTEAVFDARDHFPGWIDLDVSLADGSDAKLWIEARCSPPKADGRDRVSAQAPAGDRVLVGPLPAGEWSLLIRPLSKDWTWSSPAPIAVAPASLVPLHYDIDPDELR